MKCCLGKHRRSAPLKTKPAIGHDTKPVLSIPVLKIQSSFKLYFKSYILLLSWFSDWTIKYWYGKKLNFFEKLLILSTPYSTSLVVKHFYKIREMRERCYLFTGSLYSLGVNNVWPLLLCKYLIRLIFHIHPLIQGKVNCCPLSLPPTYSFEILTIIKCNMQ